MKNNNSKALVFANFVLGSAAIIFILAIFYLWYRSNSLQHPLHFKLAALLIAGLLFSIIILFLRDSWKINFAITLFSVVVAVYGIEFVLFVGHNLQPSQTEIDTRSKLEVIEDLRTEGVDAWPQVFSNLFLENNGLPSGNNRLLPLGGISQKTIVNCNESGDYHIFKSDKHGFNNPEGIWESATKVALIGDSFTLGACVMPGEDIANQLRNMGINALNLGNSGNGPLIELAILKEYAEPIQSQIILWIYYEGNDLIDLKKERTTPMLMRYLEDGYSQNLLERQDEIDATMIKYVNSQWVNIRRHWTEEPPGQEQTAMKNRSLLMVINLRHLRNRLGLLNTADHKLKGRQTPDYKAQLSLFSDVLTTAKQRTSDWGGKLYFVYLPKIERYVRDNNQGSFYNRDDVIAIIHKLGIPLIDFHEVLNKHPDPLSLVPFLGAHYNADGYKLLSEFIVSQLRKDRLISYEK